MHKYIAKIHASVVKKKALIRKDIEYSRDLKEMWNNSVKIFNKKMANKIESLGYGPSHGQHGQKKYELLPMHLRKCKKNYRAI